MTDTLIDPITGAAVPPGILGLLEYELHSAEYLLTGPSWLSASDLQQVGQKADTALNIAAQNYAASAQLNGTMTADQAAAYLAQAGSDLANSATGNIATQELDAGLNSLTGSASQAGTAVNSALNTTAKTAGAFTLAAVPWWGWLVGGFALWWWFVGGRRGALSRSGL